MSRSERMSSVDTTWLRMDRPANPMMIVAVWILEGPVALDKVGKQIAEGHMSYRRYRQKVEYAPAGVYWRDDPNFDLAHHMKRIKLPGRGGKPELERFVGELASEPLDFNHPLWTVHIVEKYEGGAAVVFRWHHAVADGVALVRVSMAFVDGPVGKSRRAAPPDEDEGWLQTLMAPVVAAINAGTQASTSILGTALGLARHPLRAAGLLRDGAGVAGELGYLLAMKSDSATRFKGKPNGSKRVAWSEPLKLPEVKAASRALGCTINDMLLSCVAGAMRDYLEEKGDRTEGVEVRALAPIDLRQPGDVSLGNRFGILAVLLPVGIEHPLERLMTVRQRMLALKLLRARHHARPVRSARLPPESRAGPAVQSPAQAYDRGDDQRARSERAPNGRRQHPEAVLLLGAADRRHWHGRVDLLLRRHGSVRPHHRRGADPRPGSRGQPLPGGVREVPLLRVAR